MIRCNNCMKLFEDDEYLTDILETNVNGKITNEIYDGNWEVLDDDMHTVYAGCPECLTDAYLMDL